MPTHNIVFYNFSTNNTFSTTVNGTYAYNGPATATGSGTITDNEAGIGGQYLDDDNAGGELSTGTVTVNGLTSTNSTVDAELAWTVRDTVTGEIFQVVQLEVEQGNAIGFYLMSEVPLIVGRVYETLAYDANPNADIGAPAFNYADHAASGFFSDGIVSGTSGNDTINSAYNGDPHGEKVTQGNDIIQAGAGNDTVQADFGNDSVSGGSGDDTIYGDSTAAPVTGSGTSFSWANQGVADEANVAGGLTGLSTNGNVRVTMSVQQEANFGTATMETTDPLYNYNTASDTSSIFVSGGNLATGGSLANDPNSALVTIDFSAAATGYSDEVSNVTFGIFDIDELKGQFIDQVDRDRLRRKLQSNSGHRDARQYNNTDINNKREWFADSDVCCELWRHRQPSLANRVCIF